ncbi:MFS general substrate transporter [Auricularia subglabra TFB-10046 SS5]|nr:MFS general substrate transporter [Auricularia subglabra TFB-10046 SS5]
MDSDRKELGVDEKTTTAIHVEDRDNVSSPSVHGNGSLRLSDAEYEARLIRKIDWHIALMAMVLYLAGFLDRSISSFLRNARLYGLEADLNMVGQMYQTAVSVLSVTYLASAVPSNLLLKKIRPSRHIATITTAWGIIATCTGLVTSYGQLIALRIILGIFEAGLFPGMAVYLTFFYTRQELAMRIGYLFVAAALSGACGGLLAFAVGNMDGIAGMKGWRWILIIEGLPSVLLGVSTLFLLPDGPESAYFLTPDEKDFMHARRLSQQGESLSAQEFHWRDVKAALKVWKVWAFAVAQFGTNTMVRSFSIFLPTVLQQIGQWSVAQTQLLTIPCYFLGAVTYLVIARLSDHTQRRGVYTIASSVVSMVGYALLLANASPGVHYAGTFFVAMGLYVFVGIPVAWLPNNLPRYGKRTTATGLQITLANAAGVMAPFLYATGDKPRYIRGHAASLAIVGFATTIFGVLWLWFMRANARRARGQEEYRTVGKTADEIDALGDNAPDFRYIA